MTISWWISGILYMLWKLIFHHNITYTVNATMQSMIQINVEPIIKEKGRQ